MEKTYFVSYAWFEKHKKGFGNATYVLKRNIDIELIREIEEDIKKTNDVPEVCLISFQVLNG